MKLMIALVTCFLIIVPAESRIRRHPVLFYCFVFFLSMGSLFLPESSKSWFSFIITNYILRGTLATAFFLLVMYARVLPCRLRTTQALLRLRAQLSIAGSILIFSHSIGAMMLTHETVRTEHFTMTIYDKIVACSSVFMLPLLLTLTITSFSFVRKKMRHDFWKRLQKLSYLFYAFIYIHAVCAIAARIVRGAQNEWLDLLIYTGIFGFYLVSRVGLFLKETCS